MVVESCKVYAVCEKTGEGSSSRDDLKFSNPGGAISGELGTSCEIGEGGLGCGSCSDPSTPLSKDTVSGCMAFMSTSIASNAGGDPAASSNVTGNGITAASGMIYAVPDGGVDNGCHDDLKLSNPGGAICGEQGGDSATGVVDLNNGCFNNPSNLLPNGGSKLHALSVSTSIAFNVGTGNTASSGATATALAAITSDEAYVFSLDSGMHDNLKFSNPGGGISGEQGSACVMGEGDLSSGCHNGSSAPLSDDGSGRLRAATAFVSIVSNTGSGLATPSGTAGFSNECAVSTDRLGGGSGGHENLNFSNPGGAMSGEQGSASVGEESGICIATSNDPSESLFHADGAPGSSEVTAIALVWAASGKPCAASTWGGRGEGGCECSKFSHPGSTVGQGGRRCCCGNNPSGSLFNGSVGGAEAVGRLASIDSGAAGSRPASSDTIAAESASDPSDRAPAVEAGGLDGVGGDGVSATEAATIWCEGEGDASVVAASGKASAAGGGKGEACCSSLVASRAGEAESEGGLPASRFFPSICTGADTVDSQASGDVAVRPGCDGGVDSA